MKQYSKNKTLKYLLSLLLVFGSVMLFSCGSDDDDSSDSNEYGGNVKLSLFYGSWKAVKYDSYKNGEPFVNKHKTTGTEYTFKKDGTMVRHRTADTSRDGTYTLDEKNRLYMKYYYIDCWEYDHCTILSVTADSLIWNEIYPDDEYDYDIVHLVRITSEYDD